VRVLAFLQRIAETAYHIISATPLDCADFLLSDGARFMTGHAVDVAGGVYTG
jgi:hypothetical protein